MWRVRTSLVQRSAQNGSNWLQRILYPRYVEGRVRCSIRGKKTESTNALSLTAFSGRRVELLIVPKNLLASPRAFCFVISAEPSCFVSLLRCSWPSTTRTSLYFTYQNPDFLNSVPFCSRRRLIVRSTKVPIPALTAGKMRNDCRASICADDFHLDNLSVLLFQFHKLQGCLREHEHSSKPFSRGPVRLLRRCRWLASFLGKIWLPKAARSTSEKGLLYRVATMVLEGKFDCSSRVSYCSLRHGLIAQRFARTSLSTFSQQEPRLANSRQLRSLMRG